MRLLLVLPLAATISGCVSMPSPSSFMARSDISRAPTIPVVRETTTASIEPVERASNPAAEEAMRLATMKLPAQAGAILKVREKHFSNGTRQEIILDAGKGVYGENVIDVSIRTAEPRERDFEPLRIGPPSQSGIRNEILSRFPDMQMNIVTRPMRNTFGPFGLAIGRHAAGYRCVFAWQWFDELREGAHGASNFTKLGAYMSNKSLATSVRIRLCRSDLTVDQIAGLIEGLQAGPIPAIERIARMDRRQIESGGGEIVSANGLRRRPLLQPVGPSLEAALSRASRPATTPPKRAASKPAPARQAQATAPAQSRRARVERAQHGAAPAAIPQAAMPAVPPPPNYGAPPTAAGGRYLAPVAPQTSGAPVTGAPRVVYPASNSPVGAGGAVLPPQAYRGPQG